MKFIAYGLLILSAVILSQSLSIAKRETAKDDLQQSIAKLRDEAKKELDKLKAEGKTVLAHGLEAAEKRLEDIEAQLEKLNPQTEVGKALLKSLETAALAAEEKLKEEIKKLSGAFYDEDLKNTLLIEGEKLKKMAQEEIEKLKSQGKAALAQGIEAVEKRVLDIEAQLKALNPTSAIGKALLGTLEALLQKAETALEEEVKKLSGGYYDEDLKNTLLIEGEKLKKMAQDEIEKLKAAGKAKLAEGIEAVEKRVLDIEAQLKALNPTSAIGKALLGTLEALLKKAETTLEDEVKKLSGAYYDEDLKNTLLIEGEKLKKMAQEEIEKLKAAGKAKLAEGIEAVEKRVLDIEAQLKALNPTSAIGKALLGTLEALLQKAETALEEEVKKLSGGYYDEDLKNTLLIEGEKLKKMAQEEIEKLKAAGKAKLAEGIEAVEKRVLDIEGQLEALHPSSEIGKALLGVLEGLLKKAETALEDEVKKLSGAYYDEDLKNTLLIEGEKLKKMAQEEIEKLKSQGKAALAQGIEAVEKRVLDIEAQLKALNPTSAIGKALLGTLEALLQKAETALEEEVKKLSGAFYDEDLKNTLLIEGEKLKKMAQEEIEKLKAAGKAKLAEGIEAVEKRVLDIEAQLKALNPTSAIGKALLGTLEALLQKAETALEEEVKKLSGAFYDEDLKNTLLIEAEKLKKMAQEEIEKLKAAGKAKLAEGIEAVEKRVLDIEGQLEALHPSSEIGKALLGVLEGLLKKAETVLEDEVKKLSGAF